MCRADAETSLYSRHGLRIGAAMDVTLSRVLSLAVATVYLVAGYFGGGGESALQLGVFLILPLACIWFSQAMGDFTGVGFGGMATTRTTPGCVVAFGGWLLLGFPVIAYLVDNFASGRAQ